MHKFKGYVFCFAVLTLSVFAVSQDEVPKPEVSKEPLSTDQIAIYRAVLEKYVKGKDETLNLDDRTATFDPPDPGEDLSDNPPCLKSLDLEPASQWATLGHRLDPAVASDLNVVLVDGEAQTQIVRENDPQKLMGTHATDQQLENAVKTAFKTGLFTFSEILFDKKHRRAVVSYNFYCGKMCGHGNLLIVKKVRKKWKVKKVCEGWIS